MPFALCPEPILTAAEIRAAEANAPGGASDLQLMERAGSAAADAIAGYCGPAPTLVVVGPGNNGGDGYVTARILKERGWPVRLAALAPPASPTTAAAAACWRGPVEAFADAEPAAILVDALFGTGLSRGLAPELTARLALLAASAKVKVALDFPSGTASDDGSQLGDVVGVDLTIAFAALKPSHLLYPAAAAMGRVVVAELGLGELARGLSRLAPPGPVRSDPAAHKYTRGHVLVTAGEMPGAAWLAAKAAQRAGAGYVSIVGGGIGLPSSLVQRDAIGAAGAPVDAVIIGPGLGRDEAARRRGEAALSLGCPAVLDADLFALFAGDPKALWGRSDVMTPHGGEFSRYFGALPGSKVGRARAAAELSGNVIVLKGPDTVIAAPDGRAAINGHASARLATAGSGDVLAGMIAAGLARGEPPFEAACGAVWRHGDAALRGRDGLIAEDLVELIR